MRTFVAVDVSSAGLISIREDLLSTEGWNWNDIKPIELHNIHFTLMFIGELSDIQLAKTKEKLSGLIFEPFSITYKGIGAFPSPRSARVIWVGVDNNGGQKLTALANNVVSKLAELGLRADKPFSPHVTLLRAKRASLKFDKTLAKYQNMTFGSDQIDKVHLKKSELTSSGPIYSNIYTIQAHN
ncbi:MAG TPA: RNA 2',3'-cyclic phosphodiesterase [Nitrososphaera sp.]|jgi:2'-5' RNA ligase